MFHPGHQFHRSLGELMLQLNTNTNHNTALWAKTGNISQESTPHGYIVIRLILKVNHYLINRNQ